MTKECFEIDGARFTSLEGFFEEISQDLIPGAFWGHNLDAFNDILRGGFGTPDEGFILVWKNSAISRERLGYRETVRQLRLRLARCHPTNRLSVARQLADAERGNGETVFDWVVGIILEHRSSSGDRGYGVELRLV